MVECSGYEHALKKFEFQILTWASCLISLCHHVLIYKMGK